MLNELLARFLDGLMVLLVASVAIGFNPGCSAAALAVLLAYRVADKYFHDQFNDENRKNIATLKIELAKVSAKQNKADLAGAFGKQNG